MTVFLIGLASCVVLFEGARQISGASFIGRKTRYALGLGLALLPIGAGVVAALTGVLPAVGLSVLSGCSFLSFSIARCRAGNLAGGEKLSKELASFSKPGKFSSEIKMDWKKGCFIMGAKLGLMTSIVGSIFMRMLESGWISAVGTISMNTVAMNILNTFIIPALNVGLGLISSATVGSVSSLGVLGTMGVFLGSSVALMVVLGGVIFATTGAHRLIKEMGTSSTTQKADDWMKKKIAASDQYADDNMKLADDNMRFQPTSSRPVVSARLATTQAVEYSNLQPSPHPPSDVKELPSSAGGTQVISQLIVMVVLYHHSNQVS